MNYQVFRYWNSGWKFKFRGEMFSPNYIQEKSNPMASLHNPYKEAGRVLHLFSSCTY